MYGASVRGELEPYFARAQVSYPPTSLVLVGLKSESRSEVYAATQEGKVKFIREYPILKGSGKLGPKLREGDFRSCSCSPQTPELYRMIQDQLLLLERDRAR